MAHQFTQPPRGWRGSWPQLAAVAPDGGDQERRIADAFFAVLHGSPAFRGRVLAACAGARQAKSGFVLRDATEIAGQPLAIAADAYIEAKSALKTHRWIACGRLFSADLSISRGEAIKRLQSTLGTAASLKLDGVLLLGTTVPDQEVIAAARQAVGACRVCALTWMNSVDLAFEALDDIPKKEASQIWLLEQYVRLAHGLIHLSETGATSAEPASALAVRDMGADWPRLVERLAKGFVPEDRQLVEGCLKNWYALLRYVGLCAARTVTGDDVGQPGAPVDFADRLKKDRQRLVEDGLLVAMLAPSGHDGMSTVGLCVDFQDLSLDVKHKTDLAVMDAFDEQFLHRQKKRVQTLGRSIDNENYLEVNGLNGKPLASLNADRTKPLARVARSYGADCSHYYGTRTELGHELGDPALFARLVRDSVLDRVHAHDAACRQGATEPSGTAPVQFGDLAAE